MAVEATETTFQAEVLGSDGKVIVDFWAEWCSPCHRIAPVLDRIADEHGVKLVKVNIDNERELADRYGVQSIPLMVLFENGEPQAQALGALPKSDIERMLGLGDSDGEK
jgi:thioredoxin 1